MRKASEMLVPNDRFRQSRSQKRRASGIGRATAHAIAREGAAVVAIADVNQTARETRWLEEIPPPAVRFSVQKPTLH